jgi:hypothetical protein
LRRAPVSTLPPFERHPHPLRDVHTPVDPTPVDHHGDTRVGLEAGAQMPAELRSIAANDDEP